MPPRLLRALGVRLRQARRRVAAVDKQVLGFLAVYIALIFTLPFIFKGPRAWRLGIGRGDFFPTPKPLGELMVLSDSDSRVRNGHYHDFDIVDVLDRLTDHLHRFAKAPYVTMVRVLGEEVTAPIVVDSESYWAWPSSRNKTADLMGWLREDTDSICWIIKVETKDTIARLAEHEELCGSANAASERPAGDAAGDASTEDTEPQDVRCSAENAHNRDKLLHSARNLEAKLEPVCDEIRSILWQENVVNFWGRLREEIMAKVDEMATELEFLYNIVNTLYRSDRALHQYREHWYPPVRRKGVGGIRLEALASRAATDHPDDLDPFTAVLLYILGETALLDLGPSIHGHIWSFRGWSWTGRLSKPPVGTQRIRFELEWQAGIINTTSDLLASAILPGAREWSALMQAVKKADIFNSNSNGAGDVSHKPKSFWDWLWPGRIDSNAAGRDEDRWLEAFDHGVDHLEFLRGYLVQLRHGLPGMVPRLDLWDAEVTELDDEITTVLSWGKKYTGRRRRGQEPQTQGTAGDELDITRWQISPSTLASVALGLGRLELALTGPRAEFRTFNSQNSSEDNWFESGMHRWSWSMLE